MAFICSACADKIQMPIISLTSYGRCEDCGNVFPCADVPTSYQAPYWQKFAEKNKEKTSKEAVVDAVLLQGSLEFSERDAIQIAFDKFHAENPHVYEMLVKLARQVKDAGRSRYGIECLFARLRWHYDFEVRSDQEFKLNNNFTSRYARLLMEKEKDLDGVFSVRELRRK